MRGLGRCHALSVVCAKLRGDGVGPQLKFSFETLDMGMLFVGSSHTYEVVLSNIGDIDGVNRGKKDKVAAADDIRVNDAKVGALLYFSLIGMVLTSCIGDMYHRNDSMHREPNTTRALLFDCPASDLDQVWRLLVYCYLVMVSSIGVLYYTVG